MLKNIFVKCKACSQAAGQHFQNLLQNKLTSTAGSDKVYASSDADFARGKAPKLRDTSYNSWLVGEQI
jgi:hypothetical protein